MRGKAVRDYFFKPVEEDPEVWPCRCGTKRKAGRGYANFASHVLSQHVEDFHLLCKDMDNCVSTSSSSHAGKINQSVFYSKKAVQLHGCLDLILSGLMPFNIVGNPVLFEMFAIYRSTTQH